MKFVEEVVVEAFLPTFRSMLAEALRERGLTQQEVAEALGVSQSAVSKYVHGDVARREAVAAHRRVAALVEEIADGLASGELSRAGALVEAEVLIRQLEDDGLVARLHEAEMPAFAEYEGPIRDPEGDVRTAEQVLASVRRGVRLLENAPGFAAAIPAVGSNCCECVPDAATIEDVAGVPGRIVDVKGRATVPGDPEFGASAHVARVLLAARQGREARPAEGGASDGKPQRAGADVRGCLNVVYDEALLASLQDAGLTAVEFDAAADLEAAVAGAVRDHPGARIVYQTGGFGIEPVTYVLGADAEAVARVVREAL
jgi:predicted fused transcriptional regulator/phosphomethylpyrimidine kinase/predicted transcriptional regulator